MPEIYAVAEETGSARILNVNDDEANRYSVSRILKHAGFEVMEAANGAEALRQVETRPDLVILDVHLPDLNGFDVCRRIKRNDSTRSIPVLHLSAKHVQETDRVHGIESGADGYLCLPVEQPELLSSVRNLLRLRNAQRTVVANAQRIESLEKELFALEKLSASPPTPITSRSYGALPLRESHAAEFEALIAGCVRLLEAALEKQQYKGSPEDVETVRAMSDRLGFLRAGPRDVIDIYSSALKLRTASVSASRAKGYVEEGRLLVLELMGHLVSYYRSAACAPVRRAPAGESS
jgi:DNA-binding response OmpR family regulator